MKHLSDEGWFGDACMLFIERSIAIVSSETEISCWCLKTFGRKLPTALEQLAFTRVCLIVAFTLETLGSAYDMCCNIPDKNNAPLKNMFK